MLIGQLVVSPTSSAALALVVVSRHTRMSGKFLRGAVSIPQVYWCGQQNVDGRPRVLMHKVYYTLVTVTKKNVRID